VNRSKNPILKTDNLLKRYERTQMITRTPKIHKHIEQK